MADLVLREPLPGDAELLERDLRPEDRAEIAAASGPDTLGTIARAVAASRHAITVLDDQGLVCVFGTVPLGLLELVGVPWMLGTPALARHRRTLIKVTRRYFDEMLGIYPTLANFVDARHVESLRLLRAAKCRIEPAAPFGYAGLPFHRFVRERAHV